MKHSFRSCYLRLYDIKSHSDFTNHAVRINSKGTIRIYYKFFSKFTFDLFGKWQSNLNFKMWDWKVA